MSSVSDNIELMQKYFPKCPICRSEKGYQPSAFYPNVQCKSCKAEWLLYEDGMELKGVSEQRWDRRLLNKKRAFQFWRTLKTPKSIEIKYTKMKGMDESEYKACVYNLGLLEGEEIRLNYVAIRKPRTRKGLLVFTNDNLIFMQQESMWSSDYSQALRISLEQITGIESGGTVIKNIRIRVGAGTGSEEHEFLFLPELLDRNIHEIREEIEELLKQVRQEKKRLAQEALAKGTVPAMIFCKYCGARNKADQPLCVSCGAPLT